MSKRQPAELIADIKEAIIRVKQYVSAMTYEQFLQDTKTQDAVVRNIEIMGEAVKNRPDSISTKYPRIPWKDMAKTRDKLIHDYFGVNYEILWNIAKAELPGLLPEIETISNDFNKL